MLRGPLDPHDASVEPRRYYAPPAPRKHRWPLKTRTRLTGAFLVAACVVLFVVGENYVVGGLVPVRLFAIAIALYRGLPYLLLPGVFEASARKLLGADAPPEDERPDAFAPSHRDRSAR